MKESLIEIKIVEKQKHLKAKEIKKERQIVKQQKKIINNLIPKDHYFLSEKNQKVKEQTKSDRNLKNKKLVLSGQKQNKNQSKNHIQKQRQNDKRKNNKNQQKKIKSIGKIDPVPKYHWEPDVKPKNIKLNNLFDNKQKDLIKNKGISNVINNNSNDDYLKDVKEGDETILNTKEFLYYSYYSRIKDKIKNFWEPLIQQKIEMLYYNNERNLASVNKNKTTKLLVVLNKSGKVVNIKILKKSGYIDLDRSAIEAFKQASPFPNPPRGMVNKEGQIHLRWDFILEA